jgi:isopentenyldiphosphate isomerase
MPPPYNLFDLVNNCDTFPYPSSSSYAATLAPLVHFRVAAHPTLTLGLMLPSVAATFANLPDWSLDLTSSPRTLTLLVGDDVTSRSRAMSTTILAMRETGHFAILTKWRNEQYAVYGPEGSLLCTLERAASQLFGVVTCGVHMTVYQRTDTGAYAIWVPRRAKSKHTFPSMLDNSVAGGLSAGESPWECLMRESEEEASLSRDVTEKAKATGSVTYFYQSGKGSGGEEGLLQPECQFTYDLDLTGLDVELKPNDSEVESFTVMNVEEVRSALANGEFKPNCALVMIDFLVRHGLISPENEENYVEIVSRIHRRLEFPLGSHKNLEKSS